MANPPDQDEDDDREWKRTPAVYVDYYETSYISDLRMVRIAFGEYAGKDRPTFIRTAVVMPLSDAKLLAETIAEWAKEAENEETGTAMAAATKAE